MVPIARSARRRAAAFAPYHITLLFAPELRARDPRGRGSVGAGIVLDAGVRADARWEPAGRRSIRLTSRPRVPLPISRDVARRLLARRRGRLTVRLHHTLPVGQGFGTSAAGAVATALAVASVLGLPRQHAIETAHLADLFGGGGLGGVAAILGGGLEVRDVAGVPPWGRVRHRRFPGSVLVMIAGRPLPSPTLLRDPRFLTRVRRAAAPALRRLRGGDAARIGILVEGANFAARLQLAPPALRRKLEQLRGPGIFAEQTMFGNAIYAVPLSASADRELRRRAGRLGLRPRRLRAATQGARLLPHRGRRRSSKATARLLNRGRSRPAP